MKELELLHANIAEKEISMLKKNFRYFDVLHLNCCKINPTGVNTMLQEIGFLENEVCNTRFVQKVIRLAS